MLKGNVYIYPWHRASKGAKALMAALDINRIKREGSNFVGDKAKFVINWGSTELTAEIKKSTVINEAPCVDKVANKLKFFKAIKEDKVNSPRVPEFTFDPQEALFLVKAGHEVIARTVLNGSSGKGILFYSDDVIDQFLGAHLFTIYKKKKDEYRVHVLDGQVIDVQKKMLRKFDDQGNELEVVNIDKRIRTLSNGYIFGRNFDGCDQDVMRQAQKAVRFFGLDFGAVDVIWNDHEGKAYVLEINTAPGLEGETVELYADAFRKYFNAKM